MRLKKFFQAQGSSLGFFASMTGINGIGDLVARRGRKKVVW
jgi:hypothetical protein